MFLQKIEGKALTVAITFACGTGFLLFGYDQGVFGGLLANQGFLSQFGNPGATLQGQIVSTYDIGCIIGAFSSIFIGDILGRRRCILLGCSIVIVGGALQSASVDVPMIIVARIITGCGNGLNTTLIPIWQSETSKANHRGRLICLQMVLVIFGIVVTNWMNFGFTYVPSSNPVTWRFPLAFQCFFALVTMFLVKFLPESPRWLVLKDRSEEARGVIARLIAKPRESPDVYNSLKAIVDAVALEASVKRDGLKEIFNGGRQQTFRRICLGAGCSIFQQMGGINVVVYYLPIVLTQSFGFTPRLSLILSAVDFLSLCFWGTMAAFLIDRVGRRKLMLVGAFMDGVCFILAAVGLSLGTKHGDAMAVAFIFLYFVFYVGIHPA
jgi:sugar porter (SP) family MFS transporter